MPSSKNYMSVYIYIIHICIHTCTHIQNLNLIFSGAYCETWYVFFSKSGKSCQRKKMWACGFPSWWSGKLSCYFGNFIWVFWWSWTSCYANCILSHKMNIQHIVSKIKLEFPNPFWGKSDSDKDHFIKMPYFRYKSILLIWHLFCYFSFFSPK